MKVKSETMYYEGHAMTVYTITRNNGFCVTLKMHAYETRSSWGHKGEIFASAKNEASRYASKKIVYYNRTWESWQFQTLAGELFEAVENKKNKKDLRAIFKALNAYKGAR